MKIMDRIAVILAILLVSASVVPALAGSPVDTSGDPLAGSDQQTEAGAGATGDDSQPSGEPLSEPPGPDGPDGPEDDSSGPEDSPTGPEGSEDGSSGPEEGLPDSDDSSEDEVSNPPSAEDDGSPEAAPGDPDDGLSPDPEETVDPASTEPDESAPTNVTEPDESTPGNVTVPAESAPGNVTAPDELKLGNTTVPDDPAPGNVTAPDDPALTNTTATEPGVVENESVSADPPAESETTAAVPSRAAVLCIWEQLDAAGGMLDDDPVEPGSQFLPPCTYGATKTVWIHAVVAGESTASYPIVADVTSPDGSPLAQVNLTRQNSSADALDEASVAGLVTYAHGTSLNEAVRGLEEAGAAIYAGEVDLAFNQAPGDYQVSVQVPAEDVDPADQPLGSIFTYLPTASFEIDFAAINYGVVEQGIDAWVEGDAAFGTRQSPTVRNTGNVPIRVVVSQDDMGIDAPVVYTARLGSDGTPVAFGPMEAVPLPDIVPVDETVPLSLALRVSGGEGTPNGRLWVSCIPATGDD